MASIDPAMSMPTDSWLSQEELSQAKVCQEKLRSFDVQLLASIIPQLQVQMQTNAPMTHSARELLSRLSTILAERTSGVCTDVSLENLQAFANWTPRDCRLRALTETRTSALSARKIRTYLNGLPNKFAGLRLEPQDSLKKLKEQDFLSKASCMPLPVQGVAETSMWLYGLPGPVPDFAEDEDSPVVSVISSPCSSPHARPLTPDTDMSSCPSPQASTVSPKSSADADMDTFPDKLAGVARVIGRSSADGESSLSGSLTNAAEPITQSTEAVRSKTVDDEAMSGTDEDLQGSLTHDEPMSDIDEGLPTSLFQDVDLANTIEDAQVPIAEDVDLTISHNDGSTPDSALGESSQDSAMEDVSTVEISQQGSQPFVPACNFGTPQSNREMDCVQLAMSTSSSPAPAQKHSTATSNSSDSPQSTTAVAPTRDTPPSVDDLIWDELSSLGPDFHTDLRDGTGRVLDSVLEAEPDLHDTIIKHIEGITSSTNLINLLQVRYNGGVVSLEQLRVLRDCVVQARSANAATPVIDMHNTSSTNPFQDLPVPPRESLWEDLSMGVVVDLTDPIWDELSALGPDFHTDLKVVKKRGLLHGLYGGVTFYVDEAATSEILIKHLKFRHGKEHLTLQQTRAIKDRVLQVRSENSGTTPDNDTEDTSAPTSEEEARPQSFFRGVLFQRCLLAIPPPQPLPNEDALHAEKLLDLLYRASHSMDEHRNLRRFASMYNLPWHDDDAMKRIVQCVIRAKIGGPKNTATAKSVVEQMSTYSASDIVYVCASTALAIGCELRAPFKPVNYQALRQTRTARLFQTIATSNARLLKDQNDDGCLSWQGMQELASHEEGNFFRTGRMGSELSDHAHMRYVNERLAHWKDLKQLRSYVERLKGDERLTCGKYVFEPSTAIKRGGQDLDVDESDDNDASLLQLGCVKRRKATPISKLRANGSQIDTEP